ncbi:GroES-like protein [Xylona heveae TC161]|uniref:GroES-like protein n=1 Tax=Xylona heveae (strain CBS 132557 / TC161) TaxID=1328760 RepID=A0A164Z9H7_XYLHT|nr:GroES-like protein [Xylona heveae TC161]KZF18845.1 GroES-like protein [Xylona heveae TC161]
MKEAIVHPGPRSELIESPIPRPNADQVLIKVVVSGCNPKDWKGAQNEKKSANSGDDIAGIVEAVGENITEFRPGDRVAAFHHIGTPGGSFAEYAISWGYATFHIPKKTSFEEAATIPLAAMTAAVALYQELRLPQPWQAPTEPLPLIIYGGSSAVGAYAIQLAKASNIHPLIVVAGKGADLVESLIDRSKGDTVIDYREGYDAVVAGLKNALKQSGQNRVRYAFDPVSDKGSYQAICEVLDRETGKITFVLPGKTYEEVPKSIKWTLTKVPTSFLDVAPDSPQGKAGIKISNKDFAFLFLRFFGRGLQEGWLRPHPYEVAPKGLESVGECLKNLYEGKLSAKKYVFRISDTPGLEDSAW